MKPILCLDFDGVCHAYTSGWQGVEVIPDPPVPGMWEFLEKAIEAFTVHIYSSRSHQQGGISAMKEWFAYHADTGSRHESIKKWFIVESLAFPHEKPSALVTLDDRALTFTGVWPEIEALVNFRPWNRS